VIYIGVETVTTSILGTATLVVAIISLVVKIIELTRHYAELGTPGAQTPGCPYKI